MRFTHLTSKDYVVSNWSGGKTIQIAIAPEGAVYADRDSYGASAPPRRIWTSRIIPPCPTINAGCPYLTGPSGCSTTGERSSP